jgi:hypothetical protein
VFLDKEISEGIYKVFFILSIYLFLYNISELSKSKSSHGPCLLLLLLLLLLFYNYYFLIIIIIIIIIITIIIIIIVMFIVICYFSF